MGFLRTIAFIILFYYLFKFAARILFPIFLQLLVKKAQKNYQSYQPNQNTSDEFVNKAPKSKLTTTKVVGEYIDFEEVKETK